MLAALLCLAALLAPCAAKARAQPAPRPATTDPADAPDEPNPEDQLPSADAAADEDAVMAPGLRRLRGTDTSQMVVMLEQFGVGGTARFGDWVALRIAMTDKGSQARNVIVRVSSSDSDGDLPQQQRELATNPGSPVAVWMYMRLPYASRRIDVSVYESTDAGDASLPPELRSRTGELLGGISIDPDGLGGQIIASNIGMIGVIGQQPMGLLGYAQQYVNTNVAEYGNELTRIVNGIRPADLPDRWMGLANMEAIVWGKGDPLELQRSAARADALRQWVMRGGHLVVVLPSVGQMWTDPQNPLANIMPLVTVERQENASMAPFKALLTTPLERADPFPPNATVHVLTPQAAAAEGQAIPILTGANGEVIAVRRLVGTGAVTVIGLDLDNPNIQRRVFADLFWHRILGRSGDLSPPQSRATQGGPLGGGLAGMGSMMGGAEWYVDKPIPALTNILGKSALGAAAAFVLFAVYWLLVGPPLFWALRKKARHHQSWLLFMLGVAFFSLIAWISATTLRPRKAEAQIFAILDHVYQKEIADGVPQQRARVWSNVLIPRYGSARLSVGTTDGNNPASLSTLAAFDSPDAEGRIGGFPDTRGYPIDTLTPDAATMPARSTVKALVAEWAGSPIWQMPLPTADDGSPDANASIRLRPQLIKDTDGKVTPNTNNLVPTGTLVHNMPAPITNLSFIVVRSQSAITGTPVNFNAVGLAFVPSDFVWKPGEALNLESIFSSASGTTSNSRSNTLGSMFDGYTRATSDSTDPRNVALQLRAMSFMHLLKPVDRSGISTADRPAQRRLTHCFDLSRWTTQPCLIIMGTVELPLGRQSPVPFYLDGESLPTRGLVLVRWIYPLPADPPTFTPSALKQQPRPSEREKKPGEANDASGEKP